MPGASALGGPATTGRSASATGGFAPSRRPPVPPVPGPASSAGRTPARGPAGSTPPPGTGRAASAGSPGPARERGTGGVPAGSRPAPPGDRTGAGPGTSAGFSPAPGAGTAPPRPAGEPTVPEEDSHPTLLLRVVASRPHPLRVAAVVIALVLGTGLLGGAAAGAWLTGDSAASAARAAFDDSRSLWRDLPVDELFPPELTSEGAGPGGAERRWLRVAVAPDDDCVTAIGPALAEALLPTAGCERAVRASYVDDTVSSVTTVGMVFTEADAEAMEALRASFGTGEGAPLPLTLAAPGTAAEGFGAEQRATWTVRVLTDAPVIVYSVSGFADARVVDSPQPAAEAVAEGQETAVALAGLGHEAMGLAHQVERSIRQAAARLTEDHG
ncbi:hypothetical protein ACFVUW_28265 [Streptomyces xiamenensis]|uniref:hypothetical protein n=1 Tax=Streptomyces xiamenensis TaxID=408015 RepID=UPI0036DFCCB3